MTLRCKPGDLAVVLNGPAAGRFVEVLPETSAYGYGWWRVKFCCGMGPVEFAGDVRPRPVGSIEDSRLCPIRDPGDSARDNAWDWLPAVPTKELA